MSSPHFLAIPSLSPRLHSTNRSCSDIFKKEQTCFRLYPFPVNPPELATRKRKHNLPCFCVNRSTSDLDMIKECFSTYHGSFYLFTTTLTYNIGSQGQSKHTNRSGEQYQSHRWRVRKPRARLGRQITFDSNSSCNFWLARNWAGRIHRRRADDGTWRDELGYALVPVTCRGIWTASSSQVFWAFKCSAHAIGVASYTFTVTV